MILFVAALTSTKTWAQTETLEDVSVFHEVDTVWNFGYKGLNLASRSMHRIDIAYTSKDLNGDDVRLSGYVCIPSDIYNGEQPCDGILLYNHYTQTAYADAPTRGYSVGEDMVMANPLKPNYIVVCSDFLGFGINEGKGDGQAYCYNDINGQASIDCLLAARKLLDSRGISQGKFLINAGYSSGGFDAIATQRVRDMKYSDQIVFHKTLVGGMPFDIIEAYRAYIDKKDEASYDPTCMPMVLDMFNRHGKLGFTYDEMFKEPLASKFDNWFHSGAYHTQDLMDSLKGKTLTELIQEPFLNTRSAEYKKLKALIQENDLTNDWIPDSTQRYYSMHVLRDSVVPVESGRAFIYFLSEYDYDGKKCDGFKKSIVPERTRLQTNYFLPIGHHTLYGGLVFYVALAATLTATPVLYYDGELNTHYADLVEPATLMGIIRLLESKGFDVKSAVNSLLASGGDSEEETDFFTLLLQWDEKLQQMGTSLTEVMQVLSDSGVDLDDILEVYNYLTENEETSDSSAPHRAASEPEQSLEPFLTNFYQQSLMKWLRENNVNIFEDYK